MDVESEFWAITAYFNPAGYRSRLQNYHLFRRYLNVPLLTVELGDNSLSELCASDAEKLVRVDGGDVMWQKERLLNLAIENLPDSCRYVAWLDCDVIFGDFNWSARARERLQNCELVQLYSHLTHLPRDWQAGQPVPSSDSFQRTSITHYLERKRPDRSLFSTAEGSVQAKINSGMAWAASRSLLEEHALYDSLILGMGDRVISAAASGFREEAAEAHDMNAHQREHYLAWAKSFHDRVQGRVSALPIQLLHLWHGATHDRRYTERYKQFSQFDFDPKKDLKIGKQGVWEWASQKHELHRHVREYFYQINEDARTQTLSRQELVES